jgi:decaprenyl-phosphate phosphoribosyltransferase
LAAYALLTGCYSLWLRRLPGVELLAVAGCHLLRMLGGAVATGIPPSRFLMAVVSAGALLVVAGRRLAELRETAGGMPARTTLRAYSRRLLGGLVHGAALLTLAAYALWAATPSRTDDPTAAAVSALVLGGFIWRYLRLLAAGRGGAPEELVLGDPALLALALAWALAFAGAVYA